MAERNLGLLTPAGMERRGREITAMVRLFDKESHKSALESLNRMQDQVNCLTVVRPMQARVFRANATQEGSLREGLQDASIDIVFTDIPYGRHSDWQETQAPDPARTMLEALHAFLSPNSIVAVASDKEQKITATHYTRLEKFQLGKRQVVILRPS